MKKTVLRVIFSCVLSLFMAILFLFGALCHYAKAYVCNPEVVLKACKDSGYTNQLYDEILYDWDNLLSITGVSEPQNILSLLTPEQVETDALHYIESAYLGSAALNTDRLHADLHSKIEEYAYSHNIHATPDAELSQNIKDLTNACIEDYRSAITIPLLPKILSSLRLAGNYLHYGIWLACAATGLLLMFLFLLQRKRQDTLYYTSISLTACGIFLCGIIQLANHYNVVARIPFQDSALKTLIAAFLQTLLDNLQRYGLLFFYSTFIIISLYLVILLVIYLTTTLRNHK